MPFWTPALGIDTLGDSGAMWVRGDPTLVAVVADCVSVMAGDQKGAEDLCVKVGLWESSHSRELALDK